MTYTFQQILPPSARGKFDKSMMSSPNWFAEEKMDGDRRICQIVGIDNPKAPWLKTKARFTGKVISKIDGKTVEKTDNVPHLRDGAPESLTGTVLDGEMIWPIPGARSKDIASIMGSLPARAVANQKAAGIWARFIVFDCLYYKGEDIRKQPLALRRQKAAEAVAEWENPHVVMVGGATEDLAAYLAEIWERDGEGIILKRIDSLYGDEKAWVKVKREVTHDVVIMGFDPPKQISIKVNGDMSATKYAAAGLIGAIKFGQYKDGVLTECGTCSGFDDKLRAQMTKDPASFIGRVIEIAAQLREPTGRFRHGRYKRVRDDKMAEACVWGEQP
jgi:ATP-dependent DNA ligase